jgi:hypothetical protein
MELIRYKPGEAVRWLDSGAKDMMARAKKAGKGVLKHEGDRTIGKDIAEVAGAVFDVGKGALAELLHKQAEATEYVLSDKCFELLRPGNVRSIRYDAVKSIMRKGDTITLELGSGQVTIKPNAYIVAGRIKVPIGWCRNGLEVAYDVLGDELAARCKVNIVQS